MEKDPEMAQTFTAKNLKWRETEYSGAEANCRFGTYCVSFTSDDEPCWHQETLTFYPKSGRPVFIGAVSLGIADEIRVVAQNYYAHLFHEFMERREKVPA